MFNKVLIANRGEIAVRIINTTRSMGFSTVAVYSEADFDSPHVAIADETVCIGAAPATESYLNIEQIINAAKLTGAEAIHPGYGFLAENASFAQACINAGLVFIGPSPATIELMGSKRLAKVAMLKASVPCIPGYEGASQDDKVLTQAATKIGFPLMIKASAGGGGRGMRLVESIEELKQKLITARSEAKNAFGNDEVILEKALINPRHIEVQILADNRGHTIYLGERDCSIQRRHQKVIEEAPSPFVDENLRKKLGDAAVLAAKSCQYAGAGTVEFLVDENKQFYFLEMNTRLQVEHPITEIVTGIDLVAAQLNIANGEDLSIDQESVKINGHAMEARLYAEDPIQEFLPQTGTIFHWQQAIGEGIRIDSGICEGQQLSPHYDPMLAKIIAYGANREEARRRLQRAVNETVLFGVNNNQHFLSRLLGHPLYIEGKISTDFIESKFMGDESMNDIMTSPLVTALACILFFTGKNKNYLMPEALSLWSNSRTQPWPFSLRINDEVQEISLQLIQRNPVQFRLQIKQQTLEVTVNSFDNNRLNFQFNGIGRSCVFYRADNKLYLKSGEQYFTFSDLTHEAAVGEEPAGSGAVVACMDGVIVDVLVNENETVTKDQTLVVLEAMKMEHQLKASKEGIVASILVKAGEQVRIRQTILTVKTEEETS